MLGVHPKRLSSKELKKELENRGVEYGNQNKRPKLIEALDEELRNETLANIEGNMCSCVYEFPTNELKIEITCIILGSHLRNPSMSYKEQEIR